MIISFYILFNIIFNLIFKILVIILPVTPYKHLLYAVTTLLLPP
jgi:hypothetical protein